MVLVVYVAVLHKYWIVMVRRLSVVNLFYRLDHFLIKVNYSLLNVSNIGTDNFCL